MSKATAGGSSVEFRVNIPAVSDWAADYHGNLFTTGWTNSADFVLTDSVYDNIRSDTSKVFVAKVSADGANLEYSTFLGILGSGTSLIAVDSAGRAGIAANQSGLSGGRRSLYLCRLDTLGRSLLMSESMSHAIPPYDYVANGLAIDEKGFMYVGGYNSPSYPYNYSFWAFIRAYMPDGGVALDQLCGGGPGDDSSFTAGVVTDGNGHVVWSVYTDNPDAPYTYNAYDTTPNGGYDMYIEKATIGSIIDVEPSSLVFVAEPDGPLPRPDTILLRNTGFETLNCSISSDQPWLDVSPSSFVGDTSYLVIGVNTTAMPDTALQGTITITNDDPGNPNPESGSISVTYDLAGCGGYPAFSIYRDEPSMNNTATEDLMPADQTIYPLWEQFKMAFGNEQCEWEDSYHVLHDNLVASQLWSSASDERSNFGGACYGLTAITGLVFDFNSIDKFKVLLQD